MRTLGNILWHFPCFGFVMAGTTFLLGALLTGTIVAAPIGLGLIQFSKFLLAPFGQCMIRKSTLGVEQNRVWLAYSWLVTIIYFPFGLLCAVALTLEVALLCCTIIGIPLAVIVAKFIGTYFNPVNKICVSTKVAEELSRRAALDFIEQKAAPRALPAEPARAEPARAVAAVVPAVAPRSAELETAAGAEPGASPDSPRQDPGQAILTWLRHPLHAAHAVAWSLFGLAVLALLFALGKTSSTSWPFWFSLAILPPAGFVFFRGPRTQATILMCAAPLLALIFALRGVGQRPPQIPPSQFPATERSTASTPPPAPAPPPVSPPSPPAAPPAPAPPRNDFDVFVDEAVIARAQSPPPVAQPASSVRVVADEMDEETRMETIWVIAPDGAKTKLTELLHLRDSRVSPTGDNIAVQERGSKDHDVVRVFSRQGSGYEERTAGIDLFEAISRDVGLPEGENLDTLYISIVKWESAGRLRIRADGKRREKFLLHNWQGFLDISPDETAMMPDPAHKATIEPMDTVAEQPPPPDPPASRTAPYSAAQQDFGGLTVQIYSNAPSDALKSLVVTAPDGKTVVLAKLKQPQEARVGPGGHYIAVKEQLNPNRSIVRAYRHLGKMAFEEVPTENFYSALPNVIAHGTLGRMDYWFDKCFSSISGWEAPDKLRIVINARSRDYSLGNYEMVLALAKFTGQDSATEEPKAGNAGVKLSRFMPDGTEELLPLQKEMIIPEGTRVIPMPPELSALLNPAGRKSQQGDSTPPLQKPAPTSEQRQAVRQEVDPNTFDSLTAFVNRHYKLASERKLERQMADYAEEVTLHSVKAESKTPSVTVKTRRQSLTEELADDKEHLSVSQNIESPIKAGFYPNTGRYVLTFVLSIENTYRDKDKASYRCRARIGLILTHQANSWKIQERYTVILPPGSR